MNANNSVTQLHLMGIVYDIINREHRQPPHQTVRILDVGCGNGHLIGLLQTQLSLAFPECKIELSGIDIVDFGVQTKAYETATRNHLQKMLPDIDWEGRLHFIESGASWPIAPDTIDIVVSNQVLEHVFDLNTLFQNLRIVLKPNGIAAHLFPVKEVVWEAHLHLPMVHWSSNWEVQRKWISRLSQVGFGKWHRSGMPLSEYSEGHADYLLHYTHYRSRKDILAECKRASLRGSFDYTSGYYTRKLMKILRLPHNQAGRPNRFLDSALSWLWCRVASVTLFQRKANHYQRFE